MSNVTAISPAAAKNDTRLKDYNNRLKKLGALEAGGAVAKPKMAIEIVNAVIGGIVDVSTNPLAVAAATAAFDKYLEGRTSAARDKNAQDSAPNLASRKANISKNTQLMKAADLIKGGVNFADVLTRCADLRSELISSGEAVKPAYDAYVDCARKQLKDPKEAIGDDVIRDAARVAVSVSEDKTEVELLVSDYKRMYARATDFPDNTKLPDVLAALEAAIVEAGGEVPPVTDEEKEADKAVKKLAALGFTVDRKTIMAQTAAA